MLGLALGVGCASTSRKACLDVRASQELNDFDGQSHVVVLRMYPLESSLGFEQASMGDLLRGTRPAGVVGDPLERTVAPGEKIEFEEYFPPNTKKLGIAADYYRAPADAEGSLKVVVKAGCGWFSDPHVVLTPREMLRD